MMQESTGRRSSGGSGRNEHALIHIVVSELRNSYQWHEYSSRIVVGLEYGWRKRCPSRGRHGRGYALKLRAWCNRQ